MRKIILTYGLIAGTIVAALMFLTMPLWDKGIINFNNGMVVGYATMVIALSLIFFALKSYRDNNNHGQLKFWEGVQIGLLITVIASVMYCLAWEVSYRTVASDFMSRMSDHYYQEKQSAGASAEDLSALKKEMADFEKLYENPLVRFAYTFMEIFPVGLLVTLISAGLLRRKNFLPSNTLPSGVQ